MEILYIVMPAYNEEKIFGILFGYGIQNLGEKRHDWLLRIAEVLILHIRF